MPTTPPHFKIVEHVKNGLEVYNACCAYGFRHTYPDLSYTGPDIIPQLHQRWPAMNILVLPQHTNKSI